MSTEIHDDEVREIADIMDWVNHRDTSVSVTSVGLADSNGGSLGSLIWNDFGSLVWVPPSA